MKEHIPFLAFIAVCSVYFALSFLIKKRLNRSSNTRSGLGIWAVLAGSIASSILEKPFNLTGWWHSVVFMSVAALILLAIQIFQPPLEA
jgi:NADH:ubiquinone oxidoreductase subunit 3 (subunit A)